MTKRRNFGRNFGPHMPGLDDLTPAQIRVICEQLVIGGVDDE